MTFVGVLLALLVLVPRGSQTTSTATDPAALVGSPVPDFELTNLAGDVVRPSDFRGQIVFINFWATWCGPCRAEMPLFESFMNEQDGAVILAVNKEESVAEIQQFLDDVGISSVPVLLDSSSAIGDAFGVQQLPMTFVLDTEGVIRSVRLGQLSRGDLEDYVTSIQRLY